MTTEPLVDIKKLPNIYFYHPLTVVIMLLLDWGGFIIDVPLSLTPFMWVVTFSAIFIIATVLSYVIQRNFTVEAKSTSLIKSIIAGLICAVPTGVMSTIVGTIILALSGFNSLTLDGLPGLFNMFKKREK